MARASARRSPLKSRCESGASLIAGNHRRGRCGDYDPATMEPTLSNLGARVPLDGAARRPADSSDGHPAAALRRAPEPLTGGPFRLLRFLHANSMLTPSYLRPIGRYLYLRARYRGRLQTHGLCFICPGVKLEIGRRSGERRVGKESR